MNPILLLFVLFLSIPLLEIYLLIKVGGLIGAPLTVFFVVFTAVLGAWLVRVQGFSTLRRIQETLREGGVPAIELVEGALLLLAGALLLTPGFFTDAIGFAILVPPLRRAVIARAARGFLATRRPAAPKTERGGSKEPHGSRHHHPPRTIEGEYTRDDK